VVKHKSGPGRNLDALFTNTSEAISKPGGQLSSVGSHEIPLAPIDSLIPNPKQPRHTLRDDDQKLLELSHSIQEYGLIQPIIVKRLLKEPDTKNSSSGWFDEESSDSEKLPDPAQPPADYQIIAGERRWRAAKMAGLTEVPIVIRDVTPLQMLELALIENIQRADLNPIEEATAYQALVKEFGLTQEMVAKQVGKDRTTVTNSLRLLQLAAKVQEALANQLPNFTEGHARALVGITRKEDQILAMQKIISEGLNVRQAEALAARMKDSQKLGEETAKEVTEVTRAPTERPSEWAHLESQFRESLMVKVNLKCNPKGKGTLVLHFNNQEELENLYHKLVKSEE
jgi:ParB family transcriptional regulator, chromosome partitioning protein